jgi:ABC-2 type transport system permease protein
MSNQIRFPFVYHVAILTWRSILIQLRLMEGLMSALILGAFFLLIYDAAFGDAAAYLPGMKNTNYLAFTLPISIVSVALSSSAGLAMVRDIESGYFDKLLLTPVSRAALLLGHVLSGALALVLQTTIIVVIGLLLGLKSETGFAGYLVNIGFALLLGTGFSGLGVGIALRTGNAAATQSVGFLFFPLLFLTTTFVPLDLLRGWLKIVATCNPITYVLDAMRGVLITGWDAETILGGLAACALLSVIPFVFALTSLRVRTRQL